MTFSVQAETPRLHEDASGAVRVGESRVLLELVIHAFQDGATPEAIVQRYSTLTLSDVYSVIAYSLRHPEQIENYVARREQQATESEERWEQRNGDLSEIRMRLRARRRKSG